MGNHVLVEVVSRGFEAQYLVLRDAAGIRLPLADHVRVLTRDRRVGLVSETRGRDDSEHPHAAGERLDGESAAAQCLRDPVLPAEPTLGSAGRITLLRKRKQLLAES